MATGKLSVILNHAQKRIKNPRIDVHSTAAQLEEVSALDPTGGVNVWRIPVCNAIAIKPSCLHPDWAKQSTGLYARLTATDLGLSSTEWIEKRDTPGSRRLYRQSGTATTGKTNGNHGINRGFYFSFYCFDVASGGGYELYASCGWSNTGDATAGVAIKFYSDGYVEIHKSGKYVQGYKLGLDAGSSKANSYANMIVMPMRRRELLIMNAQSGEAIIHVFTDLDESIDNNTITPNERFWFSIPTGQPDIEIAPLRFPTSINVYSIPYVFGKRPRSGQTRSSFLNRVPFTNLTTAKVQGDDQGYAGEGVAGVLAKRADGSTDFIAGDGGNLILRSTLVTDSQGRYTPTIYGVGIAWSNETTMTDGSQSVEILPAILSARLDVPDDPLGVALSIEAKVTAELEATGILDTDNIPCLVKLGDKTILDGYAESTNVTDSINPEARRVSIRVRDGASALERYQYRSTIPLDYYRLTAAYPANPSTVSGAFRTVAIEDLDLTDDTFRIAASPPKDCSSFSLPIEVGSTPAKELNGFVEAFAAGYIWGVKPYETGIKGYFLPPPSGAGKITVYSKMQDAIDAGARYNQTWFDYASDDLPIEGNEVLIQGINPQTKVVITSYGEDAASKNPETAPSSRPDNWVGEDRPVGYQSPKLTRQADIDRLRDQTLPIISAKRQVCSFKSHRCLTYDNSDVPLWRGDMVTLDGLGVTVPIASFTVDFILEMDSLVVREASYVCGAVRGKGARSRRDHRDHVEDSIARGRRLFGSLNEFIKAA